MGRPVDKASTDLVLVTDYTYNLKEDFIELPYREWFKTFMPRTWEDDLNYVREYETFGEDLATILETPCNNVWTVLSSDTDDELYIVNGIRLVNRISYIVTERPWKDGVNYQVEF